MDYATAYPLSSCHTPDDVVAMCRERVPAAYRARPWQHPELNHGTALLASATALDCYMAAYGEMHLAKCRAALMSFPYEMLTSSFEIVDWGCGQGIASMAFIDAVSGRASAHEFDRMRLLRRVTLIEPSAAALCRAESNVRQLTAGGVTTRFVNSPLPGSPDALQGLDYTDRTYIHLFSNILDISTVDLTATAQLIAGSRGRHIVLGVGPMNGNRYRIERFCAMLSAGQFFTSITDSNIGRLRLSGHTITCFARGFVYDGSPLDTSKAEQIRHTDEEVYDEFDVRSLTAGGEMNATEAEVAKRLQDVLGTDDILYVKPKIVNTAVDFSIMRPGKGLLLINVVEQPIDTDNRMQPIAVISTAQSSIIESLPELQASMLTDPRNILLVAKVLIFTSHTKAEVGKVYKDLDFKARRYTLTYGTEFLTTASERRRLFRDAGWESTRPAFDSAIQQRLIASLSRGWHSHRQGVKGITLTAVQKRLAVSRDTRQKISGVAGSGKTLVLATRAVNAMKRTGGNVLVLTYNVTLASYIHARVNSLREDFAWDKLNIYSYHNFINICADRLGKSIIIEKDRNSYDDPNFTQPASALPHYAAIFVDEVQDFQAAWLRNIERLVVPGGELVVFGDPKQNIYGRPFDKAGDINLGIIGGLWNKELRESRRFFCPALADVAMSFQSRFLTSQPRDEIAVSARQQEVAMFNAVTYHDLRHASGIQAAVKLCREIIAESDSPAEVAILAATSEPLRDIDLQYRKQTGAGTETTIIGEEVMCALERKHNRKREDAKHDNGFMLECKSLTQSKKYAFTTDCKELKVSTIHSFKGWEAPSVIVLLTDNFDDTPGLIYVAITRAREQLAIINLGNDYYHDFFSRYSV